MSTDNIFGKSKRAYTGKAHVTFSVGGVPVDAEINTTDVVMQRSMFQTMGGQYSFFILYGKDLEEGSHDLEMSPGGNQILQFRLNGESFYATGSGSVIVSQQQAKQEGNFTGYFFDGIGRQVDCVGSYDCLYTFP